jgi:hypothetical protein
MATMAIKVAPHVSWRRTTLGGIAAVGGFVALIGAWMAMRAGHRTRRVLMAAGKLGSASASSSPTSAARWTHRSASP